VQHKLGLHTNPKPFFLKGHIVFNFTTGTREKKKKRILELHEFYDLDLVDFFSTSRAIKIIKGIISKILVFIRDVGE
jgi:hypothetical protein